MTLAPSFINRAGTVLVDWPAPEHARLRVTRGAQRNALRLEELEGLADAASHLCEARPKVVSIQADGPSFGVGGDIPSFAEALSRNEMAQWLHTAITHFHRGILQLRALDAAIVVGVQGAAAGGTLGLVWCADHVIVGEDLAINMAYARLGGSPDGGTSWFLPRLVNPLRAFEMFTLTPTLRAEQALAWGLANRVVPVDQLGEAIDSVASKWLDVPTESLRNMKCLLRAAQARDLRSHLEQELEGFVRACEQPAFTERVQGFLAKS